MRRVFVLLLATLTLGCASAPEISVRSEQTSERYTATFDRALFSQNKDGQIDLILLSGEGDGEPGMPLRETRDGQVRQMVHLRVLWTPRNTIRLDSPSAGNAVINWHVVADANDRLSYKGACWAEVDIDDDEAEVDLRNAVMSISRSVGSVNDPLKRATLDGNFTATRADAVVQSYVTELAAIEQADLAAR